VHRARPGGCGCATSRPAWAITGRSAYGIITGPAAAGYVVKERDGRRNRYQIQPHLPLPGPASQGPATGEGLALLTGVGKEGPGTGRDRTSLRRQAAPLQGTGAPPWRFLSGARTGRTTAR
jgi:hypothetical protein